MSTTNILDLNNRIDALEKNSGGGGSADSAKRSDIATEFSATTAYTAGCFVYYEGKLYQFNADHAAGAWDPTDVVEANVTDQVVSNASAIAGLTASGVAYVNTTSGLTATDVQEAIDELSGINKHYGTAVSLTSYTAQDNYYTCPSDGVVLASCAESATSSYLGLRCVDFGNNNMVTSFGTGSGAFLTTVPVIKGQRLWISTNSATPLCNYYPIEH